MGEWVYIHKGIESNKFLFCCPPLKELVSQYQGQRGKGIKNILRADCPTQKALA